MLFVLCAMTCFPLPTMVSFLDNKVALHFFKLRRCLLHVYHRRGYFAGQSTNGGEGLVMFVGIVRLHRTALRTFFFQGLATRTCYFDLLCQRALPPSVPPLSGPLALVFGCILHPALLHCLSLSTAYCIFDNTIDSLAYTSTFSHLVNPNSKIPPFLLFHAH